MRNKTEDYLKALRAIYNETHTSSGGSFSMTRLLSKLKVPHRLSIVLQEEKLIRKTGTTRDIRYFWSAPVQPNLKMAEIAMGRVESSIFRKENTELTEVKAKSKPLEVVSATVDKVIQPTKVKEVVAESSCKPLEYRVSFFYGLFKYEKIIN